MKAVTPKYERENKGHYSPGIISGGMLYVSGQLSVDPDTGKVAEGGIEAQTSQAFKNLERVLKEGGSSFEKVVQCRVYISDMSHWDTVNRIYGEIFKAHKPARIVVPVGELHFGCLIEVEAVADV